MAKFDVQQGLRRDEVPRLLNCTAAPAGGDVVKHPFDSDDMDRTTPQTEDSAERGFVDQGNEADPDSYRDLGWSDELDQEGDIADEGRGHRG